MTERSALPRTATQPLPAPRPRARLWPLAPESPLFSHYYAEVQRPAPAPETTTTATATATATAGLQPR